MTILNAKDQLEFFSRKGDRVCALLAGGGYAEVAHFVDRSLFIHIFSIQSLSSMKYVSVDEGLLFPTPNNLSDEMVSLSLSPLFQSFNIFIRLIFSDNTSSPLLNIFFLAIYFSMTFFLSNSSINPGRCNTWSIFDFLSLSPYTLQRPSLLFSHHCGYSRWFISLSKPLHNQHFLHPQIFVLHMTFSFSFYSLLGASGVGMAATQLAKHANPSNQVIVTAGCPSFNLAINLAIRNHFLLHTYTHSRFQALSRSVKNVSKMVLTWHSIIMKSNGKTKSSK